MSYDLIVFKPVPGRDPKELVNELLEEDERDQSDSTVDPDLQKLADEIELQTAGMACCNASRCLCDINVSYAFDEPEMTDIIQSTLACLQRWQSEHGLLVYDPQTDELIDPESALQDIISTSKPGRAIIRELSSSIETAPAESKHRPWWKFWSR